MGEVYYCNDTASPKIRPSRQQHQHYHRATSQPVKIPSPPESPILPSLFHAHRPITLLHARNPLIPCRARPPRRPSTREIVIQLLQRQARRLGHKQPRKDQHRRGDAKVKVSHIRAHIPVTRAEHVRRPEGARERERAVRHRRARLAVRAQTHAVHLRAGEPDGGADAAAEDEGPDAEEGDKHVLGRRRAASQPCADGAEDEHAGRHAAVAHQHGPAAPAVLEREGPDEGAGEDAQCDNDVDEEGVRDTDAGEEERGVGHHELDSRDAQPDEDERRDGRAADVVAVEDLRPRSRRARGSLDLDVRLYLAHLCRDGGRGRILVVEAGEGLAGGLLAAVDEQPAGRFGEHEDTDAVDDGERDLAHDRRLPRPVTENVGGPGAHSCGSDIAHGEPDVVQGEEHAAAARGHAFGAIDGGCGEKLADADAADAFADHVVGEVPRGSEHARGANKDQGAADLDGPTAAKVVASDAAKDAANGDEDVGDADEGLLQWSDMTDFHQLPGRGWIGSHMARPKCFVVRWHQQHNASVAGVEVADPRTQGHPQGEQQHEARRLLGRGVGSMLSNIAGRAPLDVIFWRKF